MELTKKKEVNTDLIIDLGYIGNKANKLQKYFDGYSKEPNEYGRFLKFENYTSLVVNKGVVVFTNCFENEEHFLELLHNKLLMDF